jgi:mono/diheme cytochrome c family protein
MRFLAGILASCALGASVAYATITPEQAAQLPPPAGHQVDFSKEIKPIFEASCIKCHGRGREKGGFRIDNRETLLKGGDSGAAVVPAKSSESLLIELVQGFDPDNVMPKKGSRLTAEQIGLLRAWIDQGAAWDPGVTFGRIQPANLQPRLPEIPPGPASANPIDRFLQPYFVNHQFEPPAVVSDRLFARRAYLDLVGLLPTTAELEKFLADKKPNKRERLVEKLLGQDRDYAENWLTFWNDLLRNDYKGTGYIDGGRKQITTWLYSALLTNKPYDQFVAELINPTPECEGFTKGIVWRGVVNASQTPQMQAAQSISQVFMGVNLKCASCHDSFVNDLTLADSYGLAGIYAEGPLEMVQCDKPLGKKAELKFFYPELGNIEPDADRPARLRRLAEIITQKEDGRLTRTLVNRLWQRFMGRGLVEPVDEMEKPAWNQDLLDCLAEDFASHDYDVRFLIRRILTSRAYQLPAVNYDPQNQQGFVFRGPAVRRMTAEQFRDSLTSLAGVGYPSPLADIGPEEKEKKRFAPPFALHWIWNDKHAAEAARPGHVYFRKIVHLDKTPADATALVLCDNSFTLFVNGKKLGSGSDFKTAFLYNLRPWLKPGDNVFAIDAVNHLRDNTLPTAQSPPPGSDNPAGLVFYARLRAKPGKAAATNDVGSDASWFCSSQLTSGWEKAGFAATDWQPAVELGPLGMIPWRMTQDYLVTRLASAYPGRVRASLVAADSLLTALGRPNREQVVTTRPPEATTSQALELTNGETLADVLKRGAGNLLADPSLPKGKLVVAVYEKALGRVPTSSELKLGRELTGQPAQPAGVEDLLWAVTMLPEFQLIY